MNQHTPGPWSVRGPAGIDKDYAIIGDNSIIAESCGRVGEVKFPNAYANARLMAAAPELLLIAKHSRELIEALKPVFNLIDKRLVNQVKEINETIDEVIEKAEGKL